MRLTKRAQSLPYINIQDDLSSKILNHLSAISLRRGAQYVYYNLHIDKNSNLIQKNVLNV